jgi:hypothetical protein
MAIDTTDLANAGLRRGNETTRLALKATDAALACSIPKQEVLERVQEMTTDPERFTGDLLFSDVATRLQQP